MRLSINICVDDLFVHFLFDYMLMLWTIPVDTNQKYYFHKTNRPVRKLLFLVSFCSFCCFIHIIIVSTIARWFQPVKPTEKYKNYQLVRERSKKNGPHFPCQGFARASFYYPLPFYVLRKGVIYSKMTIY